MNEQIQMVEVAQLHGFRNHPFRVKYDEDMQTLCDSIRQYGILSPLLVRPTESGFEIISGHRRRAAAQHLGLDKLPVLVREMTDDEAIILMVDSNIQRENLLPSEKAFAYKMKMEAIKHQGKATSCKVCTKSRSDEIIAAETKVSPRTIQNYIRLTNLSKPILDMMDEKHIALSTGVALSYLTNEEQEQLLNIMQTKECTPSLSQAIRMKKLSKDKSLQTEGMRDILSEEKPNQIERIRIEVRAIRKYFPRNYTSAQMEKSIMEMLEKQYRDPRPSNS